MDLQPPVAVADVREGAPSEVAVGEDAPRHPDPLEFGGGAVVRRPIGRRPVGRRLHPLERREGLAQLVGPVEGVAVGVDAEFPQPGEFREAVPYGLRPLG